ncbi:hypothetical protein ABW19_dt0205927 [Dactylella cylindrospora]|nr:hypothetical protein ABW19_dt0205927 [Dactylella cylindrospora]
MRPRYEVGDFNVSEMKEFQLVCSPESPGISIKDLIDTIYYPLATSLKLARSAAEEYEAGMKLRKRKRFFKLFSSPGEDPAKPRIPWGMHFRLNFDKADIERRIKERGVSQAAVYWSGLTDPPAFRSPNGRDMNKVKPEKCNLMAAVTCVL